jgi:hypothetical protein
VTWLLVAASLAHTQTSEGGPRLSSEIFNIQNIIVPVLLVEKFKFQGNLWLINNSGGWGVVDEPREEVVTGGTRNLHSLQVPRDTLPYMLSFG